MTKENHPAGEASHPKKSTEDIARETLTGDLRDIIIDIVKTTKNLKPWKDMKESEQKELVAKIENRTEHAIKKAVRHIAADGRKTVSGTLEQITVKDGLKCVITLPKHSDMRHSVIDAQGATVLMVVVDDSRFKGEKGPVKTDKDQPDLPVADKGKNIPQNKDTANGELKADSAGTKAA